MSWVSLSPIFTVKLSLSSTVSFLLDFKHFNLRVVDHRPNQSIVAVSNKIGKIRKLKIKSILSYLESKSSYSRLPSASIKDYH